MSRSNTSEKNPPDSKSQVSPCKTWGIGNKIKNCLAPDAEVPAALMVLREELAGRAEAAYLFHGRGRGRSACAEEFGGLVFFKGMILVVLAYFAILPADLPVLFGIRYTVFALIKHALVRCAIMDNTFF
jgi:hypothetical protein